MGFIDEDRDLIPALENSGVEPHRVFLLRGPNDLEAFEIMMDGSQWGESAEKFLAQGRVELADGHSLVCVEVHNDEEAAQVADVLVLQGVHSIIHFGTLVDTRLTA